MQFCLEIFEHVFYRLSYEFGSASSTSLVYTSPPDFVCIHVAYSRPFWSRAFLNLITSTRKPVVTPALQRILTLAKGGSRAAFIPKGPGLRRVVAAILRHRRDECSFHGPGVGNTLFLWRKRTMRGCRVKGRQLAIRQEAMTTVVVRPPRPRICTRPATPSFCQRSAITHCLGRPRKPGPTKTAWAEQDHGFASPRTCCRPLHPL